MSPCINNAGYGLIGGVEQVEIDRVRAQFEPNVFGTVMLIPAALPVMRRQRGGLIVNVSSVFAAGLCPPAIFYVASKAALETISQALAVEAAPEGVRVTNLQPGPVMTELSREWGDRLAALEDPRPTLSDELYDWVMSDECPAVQSPGEVAEALCRVVAADSPDLASQSGTASQSYVEAALRDPFREAELARMQAAFARIRAARGGGA